MYEKLECLRESENQRSEHVISVYSKKNNQRIRIIGHNSDDLAKVVDGLTSESKVLEEPGSPVVELRFLVFIFCM